MARIVGRSVRVGSDAGSGGKCGHVDHNGNRSEPRGVQVERGSLSAVDYSLAVLDRCLRAGGRIGGGAGQERQLDRHLCRHECRPSQPTTLVVWRAAVAGSTLGTRGLRVDV